MPLSSKDGKPKKPKIRKRDISATLGRRFSTAVVIYHAAVAERLGLGVADWKCGEIVSRTGPVNPSRLAELSGMSNAAVTLSLDRLEKIGMVRRERDPNDRRKVSVHFNGNFRLAPEVYRVFGSFRERLDRATEHYNEAEVALVDDFLERAALVLEEETLALREAGMEAGDANGL